MASFILSLWEDLGPVVEVELADVPGGEERPLLLVRPASIAVTSAPVLVPAITSK